MPTTFLVKTGFSASLHHSEEPHSDREWSWVRKATPLVGIYMGRAMIVNVSVIP